MADVTTDAIKLDHTKIILEDGIEKQNEEWRISKTAKCTNGNSYKSGPFMEKMDKRKSKQGRRKNLLERR